MVPPASVPSVQNALLLISLICLSTLLTWLARLACSPDARHWLRAHPRLGPSLMLALAAAGAIFPGRHIGPWLAAQRDAREAEARRAVLDSPLRVAGMDMPAGTVLRLATPGDMDTFLQADFPGPASVHGLRATQLWRHPATGEAPESWSLALGGGAQAVDGWTCAPGHRVELRLRGDKPRFESCHLAAGNRLADQPLPAGTWVARTADGAGWRLRTEGSEAVDVRDLPLLRADIQLDARRRMTAFEGLLAREIGLGPLTYPSGTRAASADGMPGARPGDLLFSPARGRSAVRDDGSEIDSGSSVLQSPGGDVRTVLSNREAGVFDVADLRVAH